MAPTERGQVGLPEELKDYENQHVAVLVHVDPDSGTIHIAQIVSHRKTCQPKSAGTARLSFDDKNKKSYSDSNPDAKGHEGQHAVLVVHVDPASNLVEIAQVEPARP